ncbi:MAG: hypothetical protein J1F31_02050 [Erysipelotrichales bacterium]|nr:hypothetical protein [Erysipelotrichales bacterium]
MKKTWLFVSGLLALGILSSCSSTPTLTFSQDEYQIYSGDKVTVKENYRGVKYEIVSCDYENITLDSNTGTFTYDETIPNGAQVLYIATYKDIQSEPIVITLLHEYEDATIEFQNLSDYVVNGEFVTGKASLPYAVTYTLKDRVPGITINEYTGKVSYTSQVEDGTEFTVVAHTHNGVTEEKSFYAMTKNFVKVENTRQVTEKGSSLKATYVLDFSENRGVREQGVIALTNEKNVIIDSSNYTYDKNNNTLTISSNYLNTLMDGENVFKIITARNAVTVTVEIATKFIYTASDLASINDSEESLEGYYILMDDIDMTEYLAKGGEGYNDGKGWTPIGLYQDVLDYNIATKKAFKGTFEGNGHVISNVQATRHDESSFNCGLFGYLTTSAVIRNLGVTGYFNVSSYSGGLVGSNSGTITNCWADVDMEVYTGEEVYRYVGGFVGNNFGIIENCYSLGNVNSDQDFGSFAGYNEGDIINCFAMKTKNSQKFLGFGTNSGTTVLAENLDQLKSLNWEEYFSKEYWNFEIGNLPTLKNTLKEYAIRRIAIDRSILQKNYFMGDKIEFKTKIYPESLQSEYEHLVTYSVEKNGGIKFTGNVLDTLNAKEEKVVVTASLEYEGDVFEDTVTIILNTKIEEITLETSLTTLKAGFSYKLTANYSPIEATEGIIYHASATSLAGITINDDILTIDEDVQITQLEIYATSAIGKVRSNTLKFSINVIKSIGKDIVYNNDTRDLEFKFDSMLDLNDMSVLCFGKPVAYEVSNNVVTINKSYLDDVKDTRVPVVFTLNDGTRYRADAYYMSHDEYTLEYVKSHEQNVIEINSYKDFDKYFNVLTYDESKYENYDKVFVLTSDINFQGKEIRGIGFSSDDNSKYAFKGKIYGCGHTISNFTIRENEMGFTEGNNLKTKYGVGLIGCLDGGELYDIKLSNIKIRGNNFVGGLVGLMKTGIVENCEVINNGTSSIMASDYEYSQEDIHVGGIVGISYGGKCFANYYKNITTNAIG